MRYVGMILTLACAAAVLVAQERAEEGPTNDKAQKTSLQKLDRAMENQQLTAIEFLAHVTAREAAVGRYQEALQYLHDRKPEAALDVFKKADKQDGGRCLGCQRKMVKYGMELRG
jgi:hypothetical protein